jgi:carboxynorspermidine decarboxylase
MDIVDNHMRILILDTSAACHMPDVLEMPYRPPLAGAGEPGEKPYTYRLSSRTCLAGDVIGDYSFDEPVQVGDRLCFEDMAIYTMVKNNTFNGMPLPAIALRHADGDCELVKTFGYEDFKERLS